MFRQLNNLCGYFITRSYEFNQLKLIEIPK
jgi:hypothetical protein